MRTGQRPQTTCIENLVKFGNLVFRDVLGDRQIIIHTDTLKLHAVNGDTD